MSAVDPGIEVRAGAAGVVFDVVDKGASLDAALGSRAGAGRDRALLQELSYGALRWYWRYKGLVDALVQRPLKKADRPIEAVIIVGLYQLEQMRLPAHAAIHSSVESCRVLGRPGLKGLVNGVLRTFQRRGPALVAALPASARDAHPQWLWRAITAQWPEDSDAIIAAGNERPPMTLRVNTHRTSVAEYVASLGAAGLEGRPVDGLPAAVTLDRAVSVERLPGFKEGLVSVQDGSAQLLPLLISAGPGRRVLDACAAPGGKLTHMMETFPDAVFEALEIDPERARRIDENLERLGLRATAIVADAADTDQWWDSRPFDLVTVDAPCSGTGVIRRHPDIKVLRRASDIDRYARAQCRLLDGLWRTVAPGGRLVYVTCSILARENQEQVAAFAARTPDCRPIPIELPFGRSIDGGWQILPGDGGGDGFFYAVLAKAL